MTGDRRNERSVRLVTPSAVLVASRRPGQAPASTPASAARDLRHAAAARLSPHRLLRSLQGRAVRQPGRTAGPRRRARGQRRLPMPAVQAPRALPADAAVSRREAPAVRAGELLPRAGRLRSDAVRRSLPYADDARRLPDRRLRGDGLPAARGLPGRPRAADRSARRHLASPAPAQPRQGTAALRGLPRADPCDGRAAVVSAPGLRCRAGDDGAGCRFTGTGTANATLTCRATRQGVQATTPMHS